MTTIEEEKKLYLFHCFRYNIFINAIDKDTASNKFILYVTKTQDQLNALKCNIGNNFKKFKCFGTTPYIRHTRFLMPDEMNKPFSEQLDLILSKNKEFLTPERIQMLILKKIINISEVKEGIVFTQEPEDSYDNALNSDDDAKYHEY